MGYNNLTTLTLRNYFISMNGKIKSILIQEYQHKLTPVNTSPTRVSTNQHESNTNQHESKTGPR